LSLLLSSVLAKKWHRKESDGKTGFALDDIKNERQLSKKSFYSEKHFKYLSEEELHKMAKLSPISVSEEDIRLQADIDDIDLKPDTSAHNSQKLPNIRDSTQPKLVKDKSAFHSNVEQNSDQFEDKHKRHKHSVHKKHEFVKDSKHKNKKTELGDSYGKHYKPNEELNGRDFEYINRNKQLKHSKTTNKISHKKSKQDFRKKYKKYDKY